MEFHNPSKGNEPCCKVESVVSIDERGQMVLPKEIREKANIKAGDKLALVNWGRAGGMACIALIKVEDMNIMVQQMLGPIFKDVFNTGEESHEKRTS